MNLPHAITPRTPLTLAELETLAVMLDNASQHLSHARDDHGGYAWGQGRQLDGAYGDMLEAFYQIRDNTAFMTCGTLMPWDTAVGRVTITASA